MKSQTVGKLPKNFAPLSYEPEILRMWKEKNLYNEVKQLRRGRKKFYFLDGPPYVTNPPHVGTAWNKTLKDVAIRFKRMQGYDVRDQPGYDCHGLPIEVKVEEELGIRSKKEIEDKIGISNFIERCKEYANKNAKIQTQVFQNLGIWMDWEKPYLTYENDFIQSIWWTIKKAEEKSLLHQGLKVVHWCSRCETALAGYEVTDEYRTVSDHSIYVKFPVLMREKEYILIWTTTPWTLPANTAVMVHPKQLYVKVRVEGETYILAEARLKHLFEQAGIEYQILEKLNGEALRGLKYRHPLLEEVPIQAQLDNAHYIVTNSDFVSMDEGTGCVHMAPGHGEEDFQVGQEYKLPAVSPVDYKGVFTEDAGKYSGKHVREANVEIINDLKSKNLLFKDTVIEHSYPHCWRCKTPLILRATEQWFIAVTKFKKQMLSENKKIRWTPEWAGSRRFKDWLAGARDWVISRQRYWGAPLPIWICETCQKRSVIGSIAELKKKALKLPTELDLHRHCVDAVQLRCDCGSFMSRVPDIIDVWIDSGVACWASLGYPMNTADLRRWWPADLIIEAHDQTRGWFYSQLGAGIVAFNRVPYSAVVMHGHTLDATGQRMSKSRGNFVSPDDVVLKHGRDALRLYELQTTVWEDFRFVWGEVEETLRLLNIIWNIYAFASLYMSLDGFRPSRTSPAHLSRSLRLEDRWLLSRVESLVETVTRELEVMNVHVAAQALTQFAIEDLSRWYIKLVRRRFWLEKESNNKLAAYSTLYHALRTWIVLASPFIPFFTEKIYQEIFRQSETPNQSVHLLSWPKPLKKRIKQRLEDQMRIAKEVSAAASSARQTLKIKLRQPVSKLVIATENRKAWAAIKNFEEPILEQVNAKKLEFVSLKREKQLKKLVVLPKFSEIGPKYRERASLIVESLRKLDGKKLSQELRAKKTYRLQVQDAIYRISADMVEFKEEMPDHYALAPFSQGRVYIDTRLPSELVEEGLVRDIVRRIQEMRKKMDLPVDAFIEGFILTPSGSIQDLLRRRSAYLREETRMRRLTLLASSDERPKCDFEQKWSIGGETYIIGLTKRAGPFE